MLLMQLKGVNNEQTRWSYYRVKLEQRENCQEFQLTGVLEFITGVFEMGHWKGEMGHWTLVINLNLIDMSVS